MASRIKIAEHKFPSSRLQSAAFHEILPRMTPEASAAAPAHSTIHPAAVHAALGNKLRWEMMAMRAQDARYLFYYTPERLRPRPGVFDCGGCTARFPVR
jgi:hypothetical protein